MSLLPALFQNIDPMPMALGAKIVAPVPKKLDPIEAFEKGVHTPDGKVHFGYAKGQGEFTVVDVPSRRQSVYDDRRWVKGEWGPLVEGKIPVGETVEFFTKHNGHAITPPAAKPHDLRLEAQIAVHAAIARGVDKEHIRGVLRVCGAERVSNLSAHELPRFTRAVADLAAPYIGRMPTHAIAPDIRAIRALSDEVATPRQNAIAAKMAEVQRQKQELRALARKDYKR